MGERSGGKGMKWREGTTTTNERGGGEKEEEAEAVVIWSRPSTQTPGTSGGRPAPVAPSLKSGSYSI